MTDTTRPTTVTFDFIKSHLFRVVHADGVFGGISPRGKVMIGFFNERAPFPTQATYAIEENGTVGSELRDRRAVRDAIVRELEVAVMMDLHVARSFRKWLDEKIEQAETLGVKEPGAESHDAASDE